MKNKTVSFDTIIITMIIFFAVLLLLISIASPTIEKEDKHECTTFTKYNEHYQITPMSWGYRDSFKCIECKKDYKD